MNIFKRLLYESMVSQAMVSNMPKLVRGFEYVRESFLKVFDMVSQRLLQ